MSIMTKGIIGMPYTIAMNSEMSRRQFYSHAQVLLAESDRLAEEYDKAWRHDLNDKNNVQALTAEVVRLSSEIERLKASLSAPESVTADPAAGYDALRKQFLALRTLANSNARMVSHWRNQCGAETREALLTNAANVSAERDTNQVLSDSLLAAEDERDQLKAENNKLKTVCGAFDRVNTKLKAENEALRKDAGRYLWMQNWYIEERPRADINPWGHVMVTTPLVLDACIDAAMAR